MRLEIRPSTAADVEKAMGKAPVVTLRSWSGYVNGTLIGIGGFMVIGKGGSAYFQVFSQVIDRHAVPKTAIWRGAQFLKARAREIGAPVYAIADPAIASARKFLERLGFVYLRDVEGMEEFVWQIRQPG